MIWYSICNNNHKNENENAEGKNVHEILNSNKHEQTTNSNY
jgi:hypothetical protein